MNVTYVCVYTGCNKKIGTPDYLEKYELYKKMFQIKVVNDLFTDLISLN